MKHLLSPLFLAAALLTAACTDDTPATAPDEARTSEAWTDDTTAWTYLSLSTGRVVGRSALGDARADSLWAARTDWDIATYGSLLRTNGGTSGGGRGAIGRSDAPFDLTAAPPATGLVTDCDTVELW